MKNFLTLFCLGIVYTFQAQELDQVQELDSVLIDTKTPLSVTNSGKVVTVISEEILEQNQGNSVAELLNEVSGFEINGNSSNEGQNLLYYVRGGNNRQVVIMVDGVQLNDASQISNDYDLRLIPVSNISSIEIMKGASSVLYGSGAGTAVINIITKKSDDLPMSGGVSSTISTNQSSEDENYKPSLFTNSAYLNGIPGNFFYRLDFAHRYANGLSAIAAPEGEEPFESDVYDRFNAKATLGYNISDELRISRFVSMDKFKSDFDDFSYTDADNRTITDQFRTGGQLVWNYGKGKITVNDSYTSIEREIESSFPVLYDSKVYTFDGIVDHRVSRQLRLILGVNGNFSRMNSYSIPFGGMDFEQSTDSETANFSIIDPYLNLVYVSEFGLNLNAGARVNNHSIYDTHLVYHLNPSYRFRYGDHNIKLLVSYSTAYITPSLFQIYDPLYGNEELEPEVNTTVEGGFVYNFKDVFTLSVVYFDRSEENFVDFVNVDPVNFIYQYQNVTDDFGSSGFEVETTVRFSKKWKFAANYTNTQFDVLLAIRIPEHKANAGLTFSPNKNTAIQLKYQFVGERMDTFFNPETFESDRVTLYSYGTIGLSARTQLNETIGVFAGVFNLLNEEFEELYRYQAQGRNLRLGFTLSFQ